MSTHNERTVGICPTHWQMHSDPDTEWHIRDHVRPPSLRDDGPKCSIRKCRESRGYGYMLQEVSRCE